MSYTVTIGWWLVPTVITAATIIYGMTPTRQNYYGADIAILITILCLIILNLAAWLIWAFAR